MKHRSLLICLSILIMTFVGCSSSQPSADEVARMVAEQVQAAEDARLAAEQARATQDALAAAEQAQAAAEQALVIARQQAKTAEARAKAEAEHARAVEATRLAAEQAKAAEEARLAAEARAAADAQAAAKRESKRKPERETAKQVRTTLATGTPIRVVTTSAISTENLNTGDGFTVLLNEDITDGDRIIARRGAYVRGIVSESDPGGRVRGVATISLTLSSLTLADGNETAVKTSDYSVDAPSSIGKDATRTAVATGIGAAIGAIAGGGRGAAIGAGAGAAAGTGVALATHGYPAVVAPETVITFNLTAPLTVTMQQ